MTLESIHSPEDLRKLKREELPQVAKELRELIINVISEKGGHFASNLGTVELTVALHYIFNTPRDKVVWDVGHQSYGHKVLTGRRERFPTIRQYQGLSGFTCRTESEFDPFGAAHASTSISAAIGLAEGMRHKGEPHLGIAVIGDGALTGGLAYEAMNNAGHLPVRNLVVIFNDNEMSIDPNVGALAKFMNRALTSRKYNRVRRDVRGFLTALSDHGISLTGFASKVRKSVKNMVAPGMLFECLGFRYLGPVNGHDLNQLLDTFSFIQKEGHAGGPFLVHALTVKGKGYRPAEGNPLKYHGVTQFKVEDGSFASSGPKKPNYQDVFADTLIKVASADKRVLAITAAMPSGTGLNKFQKIFPERFYDVGIAEAHAVLLAAGLAAEGHRPVAAIYSTFLQRAYDQVIHDVGIQNLPVIFAMDRGGLVGNDGSTHQGAFDLTYLRTVPNFVVMAPKDENELQHMIYTAVNHLASPIAVRYPRGEVVGVPMDPELKTIPVGEGELLSADGEHLDVLLVGIGFSVQSVIEAQKLLRSKGLQTGVINARFAKPLDEKLLIEWARVSRLVVTVEENSTKGGFGAAVLELFSKDALQRDTLILGLPDRFVDHASQKIQREFCGIDGSGIAKQAYERLSLHRVQHDRHVPAMTTTTSLLTH